MNIRQEVLQAIEQRINDGYLSQGQIEHLRSELTVRRILSGNDTVADTVAETSDLSQFDLEEKLLISSGWLPSDVVSASVIVTAYAPALSELFKQGLLTPDAAKEMTGMYDKKSKYNLLRRLAETSDKRQSCIKLLTLTPLTCNDLIDLGYTTAKVVLHVVDKVIFLMKHNFLTIESLRLLDEDGQKESTPRCMLPGSGYSWYIMCKINGVYREVMQAKAHTGMLARILNQGVRTHISFFSNLPPELNHQILMFVDPIGDEETSNLIRERYTRPAPLGFFGGLIRFINDNKLQIEENIPEFFNNVGKFW